MPDRLRSPLLHFLLVGGVLFGLDRARQPPPAPGVAPTAPVVISAARIRQLRDDYARATSLPATPDDERALVAHAVDEELLYQDALARGLDRDDRSIRWQLIEKMSFLDGADEYGPDREALYRRARDLGFERDDPVIRRMLVEKVRLLVKEEVVREPVADAELADYLARHADAYRRPARVGFWHVFLSRARRGRALEADARRMLAALRAEHPGLEVAAARGDGFPLATHLRAQSPQAIAAAFGEAFARATLAAPPGEWVGPLPSPYGLHLVYVDAVEPGDVAPLEAVRGRVLLAVREARARTRMAERIAQLRRARAVQVEWPEGGDS